MVRSRFRPLTTTQAAAWLRVSEETLRGWATAGEVAFVDLRQTPGRDVGPGLHFTLDALEDFVRRRTSRVSKATIGFGESKAGKPSAALV